MKKRLIFLLGMPILMALLSGCCSEDPEKLQGITSLEISPLEMRLTPGETGTFEVSWTPQEATPKLTFASSKEDVARVDDKGSVVAVAQGEAKITVSAGKLSATARVVVADKKVPANEMPLLIFNPEKEGTQITDERILAHEEALGRKETMIEYSDEQRPGFINSDLEVVEAVIYGQTMKLGTIGAVIAFSKETLPDCPRTKEMLADLGFSDLQITPSEGNYFLQGVNKDKVQVFAYNRTNPGLNSTVTIQFTYELPMPIEHEPIVNVTDFPSWDVFNTHDLDAIKEYEMEAGWREFDEDNTSGENLYFTTKDAMIEKSNFSWVFYVNKPSSGVAFINSGLNCISTNEDIKSQAFRDWLAYNGFGNEFSWTDTETTVFNDDKSLMLIIYSVKEMKMCLLQIVPGNIEQAARRQCYEYGIKCLEAKMSRNHNSDLLPLD